jgi:hypothetical protein
MWCGAAVALAKKKLCVCPDVPTPDICFSHLGLNCQGLPLWTLGVVIMVDALSVFSFPSLPFPLSFYFCVTVSRSLFAPWCGKSTGPYLGRSPL